MSTMAITGGIGRGRRGSRRRRGHLGLFEHGLHLVKHSPLLLKQAFAVADLDRVLVYA